MSLDPWKKKVDLLRSRFVCRQDAHYSSVVYGDKKTFVKDVSELNDARLWKHISGEQDAVLVMILDEGMRFGAVDLDRGDVFEDAKAVRDLSVSYGIPCHIARSTKKGYHVYWFFSDFIEPHKFTSFIRHIFEELGFYQRREIAPELGLPEVFPKQTVFNAEGVGNGIKIPMIDPRMKEGWNCWVDDEGIALPFEKQWEYLETVAMATPEAFAATLVERKVEILKAAANHSRQRARQDEGKEAGKESRPKPFGDFWGVVEGCPAMQEYWEKDEKGQFKYLDVRADGNLDYDAYLASIFLASCTVNGIDEVNKRWSDEDTKRKTEDQVTNHYRPMSCKTMQDKGVCKVGKHPKCGKGKTYCMKKLPPVEYEAGERIVNRDKLTEDKWPEPSPIRFATDRHLSADDIIERLTHIYTALKAKSKDPAAATGWLPFDPEERLQGLKKRAWLLGGDDWQRVRDHITVNKYETKKSVDGAEKILKKETAEAKVDKSRKRARVFRFGANEYFLQDGHYVRVWVDPKGMPMTEPLTNFYVMLNEEKVTLRVMEGDDLHEASSAEDRFFSGTIYIGEDKFPFHNVHHIEFTTPDAFFKIMTRFGGSGIQYMRSAYDHIWLCVKTFSQEHKVLRKMTPQIGHHSIKGRQVYIMPSVLVDKDGVHPNEEFFVDPFKDDVSKGLDFKLISEDEFKDLSRHIVSDYFSCNNSKLTMTTFAHAMAASALPLIQAAVGFSKSPILWLGGSLSGGKSFVAEAAQNFYGTFDMFQNASGTAKSKVGLGSNFRHAFMFIDDYKKIFDKYNDMSQFLQVCYDRGGRPALQRNGQPREKIDRVRGLVCITAEDSIENEAAALSRCVTVEVPYKKDRGTGDRVKLRRKEYSGFTPYFIQFALGLSQDEIKSMWDSAFGDLYGTLDSQKKESGADRICENLALNMVAFRMSVEMLAARGAIPEVQRDELLRIHKINLIFIRNSVLEQVKDATGSKTFLKVLKELIQSPSKTEITNWPEHAIANEGRKGAVQIGFWRRRTPDVVYIHPHVAHGQVAEALRKSSNTVQSVGHVARQLYEEGWLDMKIEAGERRRYQVQIRGPSKGRIWVWPVRLEALGLEQPDLAKIPKSFEEDDDKSSHLTLFSNKK